MARMPLVAAGKYADAGQARKLGLAPPSVHASGLKGAKSGTRQEPRPTGLNILIPKPKLLIDWGEFMWKELREGGALKRYIEHEKGTSNRRYRSVARQVHRKGMRPNPKSDFQLKAAIPARDFFRWREKDPNFFDDDKNLKSLRRDNPDVCVWD